MTVVNAQVFMLDTDVCSYLICGANPGLDSRIKDINPDLLCISAVSRAELLYGIERNPRAVRLARLVRSLLDVVRVLPWEAGAADWYARIRTNLEAEGTPIGMADMMIAAHALDVEAVLVTNNTRHYDRIKNLPLRHENWTRQKQAVNRASGRAVAKR